jgi:peptidyl-prolyl cis-trans isomerase D
MLTQVRGALKGAVAWFVIVLLILAFALWGVPELRSFAGNAAVTVGGQSYSPQYVQNEFNRAVQIQAAESGGAFSREDALAAGLPSQIVNSITTTSALDQFAEKMRLSTPRSLLRDYLQSNENLQNPATGKFDQMVLRQILQRYNISAEEFERRIAGELQRAQLVDALALQAPAPEKFAEYALLRETERRKITYLVVTDEMAGKPEEPTPDDLQTYYDANPAAFTAPEYRTLEMLVLRNGDFREGIEISDEEVRRIYDQNRERLYEKPERRTIYQITYETEAEAQAAAATLKQGGSFESLAVAEGRTLDGVTFTEAKKTDILDPGVAEAAFADGLEEGAVVDPVEGLFGWTVAQIAGVVPPETTTFEDARQEIEDNYLAQDTRRAMLNAIDEVEEERDTGASLAAAAETAGFEVETFGPIDRFSFAPGGAIVNDVPGEALAEAFQLEEDQQSEALQLADGDGYFFVSVREIREPALLPFDEVRDEVEQRWRRDERNRRIAATVEGVRETVGGGASLEEAASQFDRAPTSVVIDRRYEDDAISAELREDVFKAAEGALVSGDAALGEAQIIARVDIVAVSALAAPAPQQAFYGQYLGFQLDQELIEAFLQSVREDYDVKVNQAQLDAIFGEL